MNTPRISVLVPVYKVEPYLQRCIDSVLAQDFQDWEMILVDDGSPDCCPEICDEAARKDERISVVHKENGGLPSARLAGFERAKGEYLVFLDSDDWLLPKALSSLYKEIIKGYDIVRSPVLREDEEGKQWNEDYLLISRHFENDEEYPFYFLKGSAPYLHSAIYRASLFTTESFLPLIRHGISLGEDWITNYLISLRVKSISYVNEPTFVYYLNRSSLITSYIRAWHYNKRVGECVHDFRSQMPVSIQEYQKMRSVLGNLQFFFFPEVPFNWEKYIELKAQVPKALNYFSDDIPVPAYYYSFIDYKYLYYLYTRICCLIKFVYKQKFHLCKEIK